MATFEVEMPDGTIVENVPVGTTKAQLSAMLEKKSAPEQPQEKINPALAAVAGAAQAIPYGEEVAAGIGAAIAKPITGKFEYDQALEQLRGIDKQAQEQQPLTYYGAMLPAAIGVGGVTAGALGKYAPAVTKAITNSPLIGSVGTGAVSGAVYGSGTGGQDGRSRLEAAGLGASLGGAGGAIGYGLSKGVASLAERAARLVGAKSAVPAQLDITAAQTTIPTQQTAPTVDASNRAFTQVQKTIARDFPGQEQAVIEAWKTGNMPLAQIAGKNMVSKMQGAAQYPQGKASMQTFFEGQLAGSPTRAVESVSKNVSPVKNFLATVDDVLQKGRAKAAPLYEKAYGETVENVQSLLKPEIQQAIASARRKYPSELNNMPDNSVKVLDYAKRELDDVIESARRSGERNLSRSRVGIKQELLNAMPESYKSALKESGDYLSVEDAMNTGKEFYKQDPEEISRLIKTYGNSEKEAYKIGVSKALRDKIEVGERIQNPYSKAFRDNSGRLSKVLNPTEFRELQTDMLAEDKLWKIANETLGNSKTAEKQIAAAGIGSVQGDVLSSLITQNPKTMGLGAIANGIKKAIDGAIDGIDDDVAKQVADIFTETDPQKKLVLIRGVAGDKALTEQQKRAVKVVYSTLYQGKSPKVTGAISGAAFTQDITKPLFVTVRPSDAKKETK